MELEPKDPVKVLFDALPDPLSYENHLLRDGSIFDFGSAVFQPHLAAFVQNSSFEKNGSFLPGFAFQGQTAQSFPDFCRDVDTAWIRELSTSALASGENNFDMMVLASMGHAILERECEPDRADSSSKAAWFRYAVWLVRGRRDEERPFEVSPDSAAPLLLDTEHYATLTYQVAKKAQHNCAHCGNTHKDLIRCTGCLLDENWAYLSISYCGKHCQSADWPKHKATCRSRKLLARAVSIARQLTRTFEVHTFGMACRTITVKEHNIMLKPFRQRTSITGKVDGRDVEPSFPGAYTGDFAFMPPPSVLSSDKLDSHDTDEALLRYSNCTEVNQTEWPFVGLLLQREIPPSQGTAMTTWPLRTYESTLLTMYSTQAICDSITTMGVVPKNAALTISQVYEIGEVRYPCHNAMDSAHRTVCARVSNEDAFVIDFTSAQFGWRECLARMVDYRAAHGAHFNPEKRLRSGIDPRVPSLPMWNTVAEFGSKIKGEIATAIQTSILDFIKWKGFVGSGPLSGAVKKMLNANKTEFEAYSQEIVRLADSAMAEVINGYRSQGLFKLCLTSSGLLSCTDTPHWAEVYQKLWLTEKEYQAIPRSERNSNEAMRLWYEKLTAMGGLKLLKP